jgi:hypothetical protein
MIRRSEDLNAKLENALIIGRNYACRKPDKIAKLDSFRRIA